MNEDLLFELSGILERVQDEGYVIQDMGGGSGLRVTPVDYLVRGSDVFHVYPGLVLRSVKRGHL